MQGPVDQVRHGGRHPRGVGERAHRAASLADEGARVVGGPVQVPVGEMAHARREPEEQSGGGQPQHHGACGRERRVRLGEERVQEDLAADQQGRRQEPARRVGRRPADDHPHVHEPVPHDGVGGEAEPEQREVRPVHAEPRGSGEERHDDAEREGADRREAGSEKDVVELGSREARRVLELARQVGEGPGGAEDHVRAEEPEGRSVHRLEVVGLLEPHAGHDPRRERQARHEQAEEGHHLGEGRPPGRGAREHDGELGERHGHERRRRPEHAHHGEDHHRVGQASADADQRAPHGQGRRERREPAVHSPAGVSHPDHDRQRHLDQRDQEEADDRRHDGGGASCLPGGRG